MQTANFTIDQIRAVHAKVRSGADFPAYIHGIKQLGVGGYTCYVADGHTQYSGADGHKADAPAKYESLTIADNTDAATFKADLKAHQEGKTDYMQFCRDCAKTGVERWVVDVEAMTCTYYDVAGGLVLVEVIPGV